MPVQQTVEFAAPSGQAAGSTAYLFAPGNDTPLATSSSLTAGTNASPRYAAVFANVPAGFYTLVAKDAGGNDWAIDTVTLTLTTATFQATSLAAPASGGGSGSAPTTDDILNAIVGARPSGSLGNFIARLGQVTQQVISGPVLPDGSIQIIRGNDYDAADGMALDLPAPASRFGNLAGATAITLAAKAPNGQLIFGPILGTIINPGTEAQATRFEPTALDTIIPPANERGPRYLFEARVVRSTGKQVTTCRGTLTVQDNIDLSQSFNVS